MDSLTQATLGAAVGEAVLGRRVGYRAAAWGAALGTLPELDVLANPFLTEMQALAFHRGLSHSIVFVLGAGALIGAGLHRLHRAQTASRGGWVGLSILVLATHVLLDCFTSYGTQVFQPFSDYPVIFGTIFIIDPLYTVPLAAGLILALRRPRRSRARRWASYLGLGLSTAYLLVTGINKLYVEQIFRDALDRHGIGYERVFTTPTPFNNVLWRGMADAGEGFYVGHYSLLDDDCHVRFTYVQRRRGLVEPFAGQAPLERLEWFSRRYYTASQNRDTLLVHDLRFTRSDLWLGERGDYVFTFRLLRAADAPGQLTGFTQQQPRLDADRQLLRRFVQRVLGSDADPTALATRRLPR